MTYLFVRPKRNVSYWFCLTQPPFTPTTNNNAFGASLTAGQWVHNYVVVEYEKDFILKIPYVFAYINTAYTTTDASINFALYEDNNLVYGHTTPILATTVGRKDFNVSNTLLQNYVFKKGRKYIWAFALGSNTSALDTTGRMEIVNTSFGIVSDLSVYINRSEQQARRVVSGFNGTNWDNTINLDTYTSTNLRNLLMAWIKEV